MTDSIVNRHDFADLKAIVGNTHIRRLIATVEYERERYDDLQQDNGRYIDQRDRARAEPAAARKRNGVAVIAAAIGWAAAIYMLVTEMLK